MNHDPNQSNKDYWLNFKPWDEAPTAEDRDYNEDPGLEQAKRIRAAIGKKMDLQIIEILKGRGWYYREI